MLLRFSYIFSMAAAMVVTWATAAPAKNVTCWSLEQSSEFYGAMRLIISPSNIKFIIKSPGISIVCFPSKTVKDAKIVAFKPSDKMVYTSSVADWEKTVMHRKAFPKVGSMPWRKGKDEKIAGLAATQYFNWIEGKKSEVAARMAVLDPAATSRIEMWTTRDIQVRPEFTDLIAMVTSTAKGTGLPLRTYRVGKDGKVKVSTLDTKSAEKISIADSEFVVPAGYKAVKNYMELVLGSDSMGLGGMGMGLDMGGASGSKSQAGSGKVPLRQVDDDKEWIERGQRFRNRVR